MGDLGRASQVLRKSFACDECKRRKVRCTGGDNCNNCVRDAKTCRYSSPSQKLLSLQRRLHESEQLRKDMERAWSIHLPGVDLQAAIRAVREGTPGDQGDSAANRNDPNRRKLSIGADHLTEQPPTNFTEHSNAEDYEFDESQGFDNSIDGMGFLTSDPHKAGYTGPQSGIAALKFLQALPLYLPLNHVHTPSCLDEDETPEASTRETTSRYIDDYFYLYHPAYPILHEGTFRARVSGALAKPRDGSWPLLYNTVVAIGAFVGGSKVTNRDIPFYKEAHRHLTMDVLEKGSLSYVQAIVLMANYLQKRNKPNAGFILIGIGFSMALAIGLHREFGMPNTSPFIMEIRRRVWWTLYVFVSGSQLTLGRPAVSLVGVNIRPPANLDDQDLAVDMEQLPECRTGPTTTSCLIAQVRLAKIANAVQVELLTHHRPTYEKAVKLGKNIEIWRKDLPSYFDADVYLDPRLELPKRILLWRSFHLRVVLNRPFLFEVIATKSLISTSSGPVKSCLDAADECVSSICGFLDTRDSINRGFAWYATYWLITASFVQATCFIYCPTHSLADSWRDSIKRTINCLEKLGSSHEMAIRARNILQKLLEHSHVDHGHELYFGLDQALSPDPTQHSSGLVYPPWVAPLSAVEGQETYNYPAAGLEDSLAWYPQGSSNAELLDAAACFGAHTGEYAAATAATVTVLIASALADDYWQLTIVLFMKYSSILESNGCLQDNHSIELRGRKNELLYAQSKTSVVAKAMARLGDSSDKTNAEDARSSPKLYFWKQDVKPANVDPKRDKK
ncbi:C6 transcription factor [Paecilomyces variotii No. 5]|uniref:C6 transcription factor n=1 Tax=Byssochlamys spectabilis (strain No. 5 / NBRC 109023) TaxID=1356009 RepID=V5HRY4_BYSSN|nr:C6 transcription factor [Paecilomyces variotii No. 5]